MTMKLQVVLALAAIASASAFAPQPRAFVTSSRQSPLVVRMSDDEVEAPPAPAPAKAASPASAGTSSALVPIKEETVEFTAGIVGGLAGFVVGGPVLGAIGAAAANYASKMDGDVGEVVSAVSKSSIEVWNYLAKLDTKYELLNKSKTSLEGALTKLKSGENVDPDAIKKVESALATTTGKITEINDEYDLVGAGVTALGVVGDLVEKAVQKAQELNVEYKLTDKANEALAKAVDKAKTAAKET